MGRCLVALTLCGACSARLGPPSSNITVDGNGNGHDGNGLGAWGQVMLIAGAAAAPFAADDVTLSSSGTELIYALAPPVANKDLYVMTRSTVNAPFGAPVALPATINTAGTEESPRLSTDDLALYFGRDGDIFMSTRATVNGPWGTPAIVTG